MRTCRTSGRATRFKVHVRVAEAGRGAHPGVPGRRDPATGGRPPRDLHRAQGVLRRRRRADVPPALAHDREDRGGDPGPGPPRQALLPSRTARQAARIRERREPVPRPGSRRPTGEPGRSRPDHVRSARPGAPAPRPAPVAPPEHASGSSASRSTPSGRRRPRRRGRPADGGRTRDGPGRPRREEGQFLFLRSCRVLLLVAFLLALLIKTFLVQAFYIPSESMVPTLLGRGPGAGEQGGLPPAPAAARRHHRVLRPAIRVEVHRNRTRSSRSGTG